MNRLAFFLGVLLQSVALGALLFLALVELAALASGARVFHYQGF